MSDANPLPRSSQLAERGPGSSHHTRSPTDSPVDEEYGGDGSKAPPPAREIVHRHGAHHLQEKDVLDEDERVSNSVVENPEELAEDYDDVDADTSDGADDDDNESVAEDIMQVSDDCNKNDAAPPTSGTGEPSRDEPSTLATTAAGCVSTSGTERATPAAAAGPSPSPQVERPVGTVGLINEHCTCYLNSLLQLLFHLCYLRSAVYRIPTGGSADANVNTVYKALQELFFQMQERTTPARTKKLTDSFGWDEQDLLVQHDIQEMATLLRDNLEERMKGTVTEGAISQLFEGYGEQFVETLDKSYTSRRKDVFYDIHIPLSDHTNLLDSIKSLTQRDQLVGDNKYKVEEEGKKPVYKDAEKGYQYVRFPPVTWFHLKRFAMDLTSPTLEMKKVNNRMEFPLVLDLRELEKGFSPEERQEMDATAAKRGAALSAFSRDSPAIYDLQGVIVHRGTVRSGHYYCYIRDWDHVSRSFTRWIEFDDDSVRVVPEDVAVNANYGGPSSYGRSGYYSHRESPQSNANAYILSYVRRADAPILLAPSPTDIITQRVKDAMRREMEEEERRTKLEEAQKACVVLYVITDENLAAYCEHSQSELFPRDARTARNFAACAVEVHKDDSLIRAYEVIAAEPSLARRGVTPTNCRLWRWTHTRALRPSLPLSTVDECRRQPMLLSKCLTSAELDKSVSLCVYVQESASFLSGQAVMPPLPPAADLMPLVKLSGYDSSRNTYSIRLKAPTRLAGLVLSLDAACVHTCKVQYILTNASNEELPVRVYRGGVVDGVVRVPFDADVAVVDVLLQCSSGADILPVMDAHVEVMPWNLPPPLAAASALLKPAATAPLLSRMGHDRVLLLLKWFDHVSCTVRYVGSVLVDACATLASLEPMWHLLMGLPVPPELVPPQHERVLQSLRGGGADTGPQQQQQQPEVLMPRSNFAFFEEGKGAIVRELPPNADLCACDLQHGAVVVAQSLDLALAYRHAHVETYYRTLKGTVDLRVLEVATRVRSNEEEYKTALADHRKLAIRLREGSSKGAGAAEPATASSPRKPPDPPPSLQSPAASTTPVSQKSQGPAVEADPSLDPFNTSLPVLNQPWLEVVGNSVGRMPSHWLCETACDAIALSAKADPDYIRLYKSSSATEPCPEERPVRNADDATVEDLITVDAYTASPVVFFERLRVPRAQLEQSLSLTVTLRDATGAALHCEAYTCPPRETLQGLARQVRGSIRPWEREANPWGSLLASLEAPHYILLGISRRCKQIRLIYEVAMGVPAQAETRLDVALLDYDVVLMPAAPLRPGEQRIACCHGDYRMVDTVMHGHPFTITVNANTSVRDGLRLMQDITHVPTEALNSQRETGKDYGVMMFTDVPLHFINWDEALARFWQHTQNRSGFIPSLLLNHQRPKEKPGSRYVAQYNPQLKIAKN